MENVAFIKLGKTNKCALPEIVVKLNSLYVDILDGVYHEITPSFICDSELCLYLCVR